MTPEKVFRIANTLVLLPWLAMMLAPGAIYTQKLINSNAFPLALALVYAYYALSTFGKTKGSFFTLDGVAKLFSKREVLLAGWIHYLVFDLFVGAWIWRDSLNNHLSHWVLFPCLLLTLMLGPVGFLAYCIAKYFLIGA